MRVPTILTVSAACVFALLAAGALAGCGGVAPTKQAEAPSSGHTGGDPEEAEANKLADETKTREAALEAEVKKLAPGSGATVTRSTTAAGASKHASRRSKHGSRGPGHGSHKTHAGTQREAGTGTSLASEKRAPGSKRSSRAVVVGYHPEPLTSAPAGSTPVAGGGTTSGGTHRGRTKAPKPPKEPKQPKHPKQPGNRGKEAHEA
jgi:hypothetical protein